MPNSHPPPLPRRSRCSTTCSTAASISASAPAACSRTRRCSAISTHDRNAMFLEGINHVLAIWKGEPPYNIDGKYWKITTERTLMPEIGQGYHAEAAAAPASADRRHGRRAVLEGRDRGGRARLGSDLGELPDAEMGEEPLAEICRGLRARRAPGRSGQLAGGQERLRRRRRQDREGLRARCRTARTASTSTSSSPR